jgi:hypothetical protein
LIALSSSQYSSNDHPGIIKGSILINNSSSISIRHVGEELPELGLVHKGGKVEGHGVLGRVVVVNHVVDH